MKKEENTSFEQSGKIVALLISKTSRFILIRLWISQILILKNLWIKKFLLQLKAKLLENTKKKQ